MDYKRVKFFVQTLNKIDNVAVVAVVIMLSGYEIA
jgi:hypothetical protein